MLNIISENKELRNRIFPIPDGVKALLQKTLQNYKGDKTIDGYKRLNNLVSVDTITYAELKRIKNFFDHYKGSDKAATFILNGGEPMKNWVNNTLYTATMKVKGSKQTKKDGGIKNAFIKPHTKNRNLKPRKVSKLGAKTLLKESAEVQDYLSTYDASYVFQDFMSRTSEKQQWGPLINPSMYQKALSEYIKYGKLEKFPVKYIYQWMGILLKNTCILSANTDICGHGTWYPADEIEDFAETYVGDKFYGVSNDAINVIISEKEFLDKCNSKNIELTESNGVHKNGQYDLFYNQEEVDEFDRQVEYREKKALWLKYKEMAEQYNKKCINRYGVEEDKIGVDVEGEKIFEIIPYDKFFDEIGLYDWMIMPDGSDAISDFGLRPLFNLLNQYNDDMSPEDTLVLINKVLDIYHQRGDLSSIFIEGGTKSLSQISGTISECKKKVIFITEQQKQRLLEAMDDTFSLEELSSIKSYRGRFNYCTQHLGKHIGKGSSRAVFQLDDEKVLKLAWNEKGAAQNKEEKSSFGGDIFPEVFESDPDGLWLVSEFVLPARKKDFKVCLGITWDKFVDFIQACCKYRFGSRYLYCKMSEDEYIDLIDNNETLCAFDEYIGNYGKAVAGDMKRICNMGLANREYGPTIVLLDSGFTEFVWNTYYRR